MDMLKPGDRFPKLEMPTAGGATVTLPDDSAGEWAYLMVFRGHW